MLYRLTNFSVEELEVLYIKENYKLQTALSAGVSHNVIQSIKTTIDKITYELNRRNHRVFREVA